MCVYEQGRIARSVGGCVIALLFIRLPLGHLFGQRLFVVGLHVCTEAHSRIVTSSKERECLPYLDTAATGTTRRSPLPSA